MLLVGNTPCSAADAKNGMHCGTVTAAEERTQMAIWALASAPLLMSNDIAAVPTASRLLLQNTEVLAINQDALGRMCFRFMADAASGAQGWKKELASGQVVVALVNMGEAAQPISFRFEQIGFSAFTQVQLRDVYAAASLGVHTGGFTSSPIEPHDTLLLTLQFVPLYTEDL